ncbi:hypothetical protein H9X91_06455 [Oscillibacter valericigenes]|uniref:Uncharacterized protein n=1 Tax=Oscillibacter valericigenes TaxID=351091 RepID=A0ABS2FVL4_9FIRM|nr:hypothetical protein [Oscillibacter valericigenes]MBM6851081.1 hypothetical protein [Oscillibacter valericigenes]
MRKSKKKAPTSAATLTGAAETGTTGKAPSASILNDNTRRGGGQAGGIASLLMTGSENGLHLQDLVRLTGLTEREVRLQIHAERRQGVPILSDNASGYFLPGSQQECEACVQSLRHRAKEILAAAEAIEGSEAW